MAAVTRTRGSFGSLAPATGGVRAAPDSEGEIPSVPWHHLLEPRALLRVAFRVLGVVAVIVLTSLHLILFRLRGAAASHAVSRCASRVLALAGARIDVEGAYRRGQGLVVCNHRSYIDILAILSVTPCSFLCKKEVRAWPLIGGIAERLGVVFVDRSSRASRAETLERIAAQVMAGAELAAFPEGTTTRGPGMRPTYPGLFRTAETHGFGVVPMVIEYADPEDAWVGADTLVRHCLFWLSKPSSQITLRIADPDALAVRESGSCAGIERASLQERAELWMQGALRDVNTKYERQSRFQGPQMAKVRAGLP
ncbi:MAG TPA: lysophospholipid acyltransferase family protein [Polyangiaceae bacterium]|nr:lysophospholipid acyltransferase family protein [Polyangiaceae bacterium]